MKPTMIKTKTTKSVKEMEHDEVGYINIGGLDHRLHCWDGLLIVTEFKPLDEYWCSLHRDIDPRCKVTVTDTREMTTDDLQVGDCFCLGGERAGLEFSIWTGDIHAIIGVNRADDGSFFTERMNMPSIDGETVTLVDAEFEAEPVDEERTVPVKDVADRFELSGEPGIVSTVVVPRFVVIEWGRESGNHVLPKDTLVTVREPATYDSIDDVSVGDVVVTNADNPGIVVGCDEYEVRVLKANGCIYREPNPSKNLTPARLTSVTWTPREEVTR